ncbi:MAG: acyltransferase [Spirochaetota bacterium]|nr:acyltransferase [Spirochaetota bacterium]
MPINKDQRIETLRGIAIILMVAGHVIGNVSTEGLRVSDDSFYRYFYYSFKYLRMPLFTVISGFVYSMRPLEKGKLGYFLRGKARRLILPLFTVSTIHFLTQTIVPNINTPTQLINIWKIYLFPFQHFWFLQAIFLVFIITAVIDYFELQETIKKWLFCLFIVIILYLFIKHPINFFSFNKALYLLPFFILGCGLSRFGNQLKTPLITTFSLVFFSATIITQQLIWFNQFQLQTCYTPILSISVGLSGTFLLIQFRKKINILASLGFYSYAIYLFHVFFSAGSRIALKGIGITNTDISFPLGLTCALLFPIIIEKILLKDKILKRLFLGLR